MIYVVCFKNILLFELRFQERPLRHRAALHTAKQSGRPALRLIAPYPFQDLIMTIILFSVSRHLSVVLIRLVLLSHEFSFSYIKSQAASHRAENSSIIHY